MNLCSEFMSMKWPKRYMRIAQEVAEWSSCLSRKVGCVITKNNRIVATGYNGAPAGVKNCRERGFCLRESSKSGEHLEECMATHAEQNAITQAAKMGISIDNGDAYVTTKPCTTCTKLFINSGIARVFYIEDYPNQLTDQIAEEAGLSLIQISKEELER